MRGPITFTCELDVLTGQWVGSYRLTDMETHESVVGEIDMTKYSKEAMVKAVKEAHEKMEKFQNSPELED